jgi:hypothetical protein
MKSGLFYISSGNQNYKGFAGSCRWNGWAQPWLTRAEVERMAKEEGISSLFTWEGSNLFESDLNEPNEEPIKVDSMLIDGVLHYQVGNGFCWEEYKREESSVYAELTDSQLDWAILETQQQVDNLRADMADGLSVDIELLDILKHNLKLMAVEQNYNRFLM